MNTKKTSYLLAGIIIITLIVMNACNSNDNNHLNLHLVLVYPSLKSNYHILLLIKNHEFEEHGSLHIIVCID